MHDSRRLASCALFASIALASSTAAAQFVDEASPPHAPPAPSLEPELEPSMRPSPSAQPATPSPPPATTTSPAPPAPPTIASPPPVAPRQPSPALLEYARHFVGVKLPDDDDDPDRKPGWDDFYLATPRHELSGRSLYLALDRKDLADEYDRRMSRLKGLVVSGGILLFTGLIAGSVMTMYGYSNGSSYSCNDPRYRWSNCDTYNTVGYTGVGLLVGGTVLGTALLLAGAVPKLQPVTFEQAVDLANRRDAALRRQYGIPDPPRPRTRLERPRFVVAPFLTAQAGGLQAALQF
jgi:hypothetical protein